MPILQPPIPFSSVKQEIYERLSGCPWNPKSLLASSIVDNIGYKFVLYYSALFVRYGILHTCFCHPWLFVCHIIHCLGAGECILVHCLGSR